MSKHAATIKYGAANGLISMPTTPPPVNVTETMLLRVRGYLRMSPHKHNKYSYVGRQLNMSEAEVAKCVDELVSRGDPIERTIRYNNRHANWGK